MNMVQSSIAGRREQGDGLGYYIRFFSDETNEPRYIEVKTTNTGAHQHFYISENEILYFRENAHQYSLCRQMDFAEQSKHFVQEAGVSERVSLVAVNFRAKLWH